MSKPAPIYTAENCRFAYQLNWSLSVFWREPPGNTEWLPSLQEATEPDDVRILKHRFSNPSVSLFLISTKPHVNPIDLARLVKGRLQYLVRDEIPKPFRRNYALRSIGSTRNEKLDRYVATQREHHPSADSRVNDLVATLQIHNPQVDLTAERRTTHAIYWYNLHVVMVNAGQWREIRPDRLSGVRDVIQKAARQKNHLLSRAAIMPDHCHLTLGCQPGDSPLDVGLSYMNNIGFTTGMTPVLQHGCFLGTFGEYDLGAVRD